MHTLYKLYNNTIYLLIDHTNILWVDCTKVVGLKIIRGVKNKKMYYVNIMYLVISTIVYIIITTIIILFYFNIFSTFSYIIEIYFNINDKTETPVIKLDDMKMLFFNVCIIFYQIDCLTVIFWPSTGTWTPDQARRPFNHRPSTTVTTIWPTSITITITITRTTIRHWWHITITALRLIETNPPLRITTSPLPPPPLLNGGSTPPLSSSPVMTIVTMTTVDDQQWRVHSRLDDKTRL